MNKKLTGYILLVFGIVLLVSCSNTIYNSLWQSAPIKADGDVSEWVSPFKYYSSSNKIYYSVGNDLENLYLCIKTSDQQTQMKILQSGIQLWIDTSGRHREVTGIQFPFINKQKGNSKVDGSRQKGGTQKSQSTSQVPDFNTLRGNFINGDKLMHLIGFKAPIGGIIPVPNNYGIAVSINWDSTNTNAMTYEAVIPFPTFYKRALSLSDSSKIVGMTIAINGLPMSYMPGGMRYGSGLMMGGGMGMGMGIGMGGMGMGMGGMGIGMRQPIGGGYGPGANGAESSEIKLKIKLAVKLK